MNWYNEDVQLGIAIMAVVVIVTMVVGRLI